MAWVETRITRTTQPQDACGIDWDNPNADGLVLLVDHQGKTLVDLAEPISQTGTLGRVVTQKGLGLGSVATGSLLSNTRNFVAPTNTAFTVVGTIAIGNTAQTNRYLAIARDNNGTGNQAALIYGYVAGKLEFFAPQRTGTDPRASSGITIPDTKPHTFGYSYDGLNWIGYLDGVRVFATTMAFSCNVGSSNLKGSLLSALTLNTLDGAVLSWATFDQGVGEARLKSLTANPYQLLEPEVQRVWIDDATEAAPPGDPTGTLSATEAGSDTAVLSGQIVVQGTLAAQETGSDTAAINGSAAVTLTGTLAATEQGADTATLTGKVLVQGALSAIEVGADTALINGSSVIITTGTLNATESGGDTAAMTGAVLVQALIDAAETGADTAQLTGQIVIKGTLAAVEVGSDTAVILQAAVATATKARPTADVSNTGWAASTGADLYAMLDEATPDALDYISTNALGSVYESALNPVAYPGGAVQRLRFRASSSTGHSVIVRLRHAGATVRSVTQALTDADTEYSVTLTAGEIAGIASGVLSVQLESA